MIYLTKDGKLQKCDNLTLQYIHSLLQELRLFKYENPLNSNAGVDYFSVFNGFLFLQLAVREVTNKYTSYFKEIQVGEPELVNDIIKLKINIITFDNLTYSETLEIIQ